MERPDMRTGETWTKHQRIKNACIRVLVRLGLGTFDRIPARCLPVFGIALGFVAYLLSHQLRRHARKQVGLALPAADAALVVARCYRTAGANLARCLLLRRPWVRAADLVIVPPAERSILDHTLAERQGCVVMSSHFGPFEYIAAVLTELGYSASVVVRESYDPGLNEVVDAHRRSRGIQVIHRGTPGAAVSIVRALRRGRLVGMLPDLPGRVTTTPVSLLGGVTGFAAGPERIALRARAPVLVVWLEPLGHTTVLTPWQRPAFRLRVERILAGPGECSATQRMADCIAETMRSSPQHCLWMGMNFQVFSSNVGRTLT